MTPWKSLSKRIEKKSKKERQKEQQRERNEKKKKRKEETLTANASDRMKVIELFDQLNNLNPESVVYAKRIDGAFTKDSEVVILELTEEEMEWKIAKVIRNKCPGFDYFLESLLIREMFEEADLTEETTEKMCNQLIRYAEYDA